MGSKRQPRRKPIDSIYGPSGIAGSRIEQLEVRQLLTVDMDPLLPLSGDSSSPYLETASPDTAKATSTVSSASSASGEAFALSLEESAALAPQAVLLDPASDSGILNNDAITADNTLTLIIHADTSLLTSQGIPVLDVTQADTHAGLGAAIFVTVRDTFTGSVDSGYAAASGENIFTYTTPALDDGFFVASARLHIFEVAEGRTLTDSLVGTSTESGPLAIQLDTVSPEITSPLMLPSSDTGRDSADSVTHIQQPAFLGVTEANAKVRILANGFLVGDGTAGSDGRWEITIEPLKDGIYFMTTQVQDVAGNLGESSIVRLIEIDATAPNTPFLDLLATDDTGRNDDDNLTAADNLTLTMTTSDLNEPDHLSEFNFQYRLYARLEEGPETLIYDSSEDTSIAAENLEDGFTNLGFLTATLPTLPEGLHNFKLEVEDRAGNLSHDFLTNILIDRTPYRGTIALHPVSDTGIWGIDRTLGDHITGDGTPTFLGTAEANQIITVRIDGEPVGRTVSSPLDGDEVFTQATWQITSATLLSDGPHTVVAEFEDGAGNRATSEPIELVVDTTGPRIENVTRSDVGFTSLFDPKPAGGPDPLIDSIVVHFADLPHRSSTTPYDAVLQELALEEGNYRLVGDAEGNIPIVRTAILSTDSDGPGEAKTAVRLEFAEPLPDDRFTLTVFDRISDAAGNPLDGESGANGPLEGNHGLLPTPPVFPTGDGNHGGDFVARFTVDSRPEIGVWAAGSVYIDTNGNFQFDPTNDDFVNRDITYSLGFTSDDVFAGNFADASGVTDGYDKLAAYGRTAGWSGSSYRWLIDIDNDGIADIDVADPANVNGLPVAGDFDGDAGNGDEVGLFTGNVWYFDTNGDYQVDLRLPSQLRGYPVVGDFDGDGREDLATWSDDRFAIDLAHGVASGWDGVADATFRFGFIGVRERPVAADMDQDGYDDLGLWVPDRGGMAPAESGEWYWLISGGNSVLDRVTPTQRVVAGSTQQISYRPKPFGDDLFAQFGDQFGIPVVGNFDPPTLRAPILARSHTNPVNPLDVTGDGAISPRDVLTAIRYINQHGGMAIQDLPDELDLYLDANQDGYFSPSDILAVISYLNDTSAAAGEPDAVEPDQDSVLLDSAAVDVAVLSLLSSLDGDEEEKLTRK